MKLMLSCDLNAPQLGFFWLIPSGDGHELYGVFEFFDLVPVVSGRKLSGSRECAWGILQAHFPEFLNISSDYFTQGEILWREIDDMFQMTIVGGQIEEGRIDEIAMDHLIPLNRLVVCMDRDQ
ncbi:hypothetical protein J3A65_002828 [Rhizobium sp. PvP014]|nr:hypothetical protein [Rhizobium sp. PvP014]MBP2529460.1 hypothetical protein [Rhizobium sp. PvP099]